MTRAVRAKRAMRSWRRRFCISVAAVLLLFSGGARGADDALGYVDGSGLYRFELLNTGPFSGSVGDHVCSYDVDSQGNVVFAVERYEGPGLPRSSIVFLVRADGSRVSLLETPSPYEHTSPGVVISCSYYSGGVGISGQGIISIPIESRTAESQIPDQAGYLLVDLNGTQVRTILNAPEGPSGRRHREFSGRVSDSLEVAARPLSSDNAFASSLVISDGDNDRFVSIDCDPDGFFFGGCAQRLFGEFTMNKQGAIASAAYRQRSSDNFRRERKLLMDVPNLGRLEVFLGCDSRCRENEARIGASLNRPSLNDNNHVAYAVSDQSCFDSATLQRLFVVDPGNFFDRPFTIADVVRIEPDGNSFFQRIGTTANTEEQGGYAINNLNRVAFQAEWGAPSGSRCSTSMRGILVGDASGSLPRLVVSDGMIIRAGERALRMNLRFDGSALGIDALNDAGQVVFLSAYNDVTTVEGSSTHHIGLFRATPVVAGLEPSRPVLPALEDVLPGRWLFRGGACPTVGIVFRRGPDGEVRQVPWFEANPFLRCFVDPPVAVGYDYTVSASATGRFGSVMVPAPLPNGDREFRVQFNGFDVPLVVGTELRFTDYFPAGVGSFRIVDIDTGESLDPSDPSAFVTGLTFVTDAENEPSPEFTMVARTRNTDDRDQDGVFDEDDNCPEVPNPSQADANHDGVGDACEPAVRMCSVDGDGDIDRDDIARISQARGSQATSNDPRDADRDGKITVLDARQCTLRCDRPKCAVQ